MNRIQALREKMRRTVGLDDGDIDVLDDMEEALKLLLKNSETECDLHFCACGTGCDGVRKARELFEEEG